MCYEDNEENRSSKLLSCSQVGAPKSYRWCVDKEVVLRSILLVQEEEFVMKTGGTILCVLVL